MSSRGIAAMVHDGELRFRQMADVALPKLERVLLCTDSAGASENATVEVIDLCKRTGASLCVRQVDEYGEPTQASECETSCFLERRQFEERQMQNVVERTRKEGVAKVDALTVTGHPPVTIVETIASQRPDLAIVGTN